MGTPVTFETDLQKIILEANGGMTSVFENDRTVITPGAMESITLEDASSVVLIRYSGGKKDPFFASTHEDAREIAAAVARHFELGEPVRTQQSVFEAGVFPLPGF